MNYDWTRIFRNQLGAALEMLENAVVACPDALWRDRSRQPQYWYTVYHTLFWLDAYLSDSIEEFAPPAPFNLDEMNPAGILPKRVYEKSEMLAYLAHCRRQCAAAIDDLAVDNGAKIRRFGSVEGCSAEMLIDNIRHVQHHAAQLNLILRQETDAAPRWVTRANGND